MSYIGKNNKPSEFASKTMHTHIINDSDMQKYLHDCELPKESDDVKELSSDRLFEIEEFDNPIQHIIAIDGGYTEVVVKKRFPSSKIAFFQFGALFFDLEHLDNLSNQPFIFPEDMEKFKDLERIKLTLPIRHVSYKGEALLTNSVRRTIFDFFSQQRNGRTFIETLSWLIYQEYDKSVKIDKYTLGSCPNPDCNKRVDLIKANQNNFCYKCDCGETIYLTDIFRLHEAIDDEIGAGGILGYTTILIEQIIIVHFIKYLIEKQPSLLKKYLFIKDGPLAFFGQTANMHKPLRFLTNYLIKNHDLFLVGLEKSGAFVDHADEISKKINGKSKLKAGHVLLLDNDYIYTYIMPGKADDAKPYARTSYYGGKVFFKARDNSLYVATIPVKDEKVVLNPKQKDFKNLNIILQNLAKLKCDMYSNSLVPIALANQLVSLANHPSSVLLEKFAKTELNNK